MADHTSRPVAKPSPAVCDRSPLDRTWLSEESNETLFALDKHVRSLHHGVNVEPGIVLSDGVRQHPAPSEYCGPKFEHNFDAPIGYRLIPYDFLPGSFAADKIHDAAAKHSLGSSKAEVAAMAKLITEVQTMVVPHVIGKIKLHHTEAIINAGIKGRDGIPVKTKDALFKAWNTLEPTKELIATIHGIIFPGITEEQMNGIVYGVYYSLGLWLNNHALEAKIYSKAGGGTWRARKCSVHTIATNKLRDGVRNRYSREGDLQHGIRLGESTASADGLGRRKDKTFNFIYCVRGHGGPKHMAHAQKFGYQIGVIPQLTGMNFHRINRDKAKVR